MAIASLEHFLINIKEERLGMRSIENKLVSIWYWIGAFITRKNFEPFIDDEPFEQYIKEMQADGEWGGEQELVALAMAYNVNIAVHRLAQPILYVFVNIDW